MSYQDLSEIYINHLLEQAEEQPLPYILKQIPLEVGNVKAEEKRPGREFAGSTGKCGGREICM